MASAVAGAAAGAAAQEMFGQVVTVDPHTFLSFVSKSADSLVCHCGPIRLEIKKVHIYQTSYKGFILRTVSANPLDLPPCECIEVKNAR